MNAARGGQTRRLRSLDRSERLSRLAIADEARPQDDALDPPAPPIALTPLLAASPDTDTQLLWHIARHAPELRRWLVANPKADAHLLEYVSQASGPGVRRALTVLLDSMDAAAAASAAAANQPLMRSTA